MRSNRLIVSIRNFVHHHLVVNFVRGYYNLVWGMSIGSGTRISTTVKLDKTNPRGIVIGKNCALAFGAAILTHDYINGVHKTVTIGDCCFIGARSIIMPGVNIGNHCIIGTGAVVMQNVPSGSVIMGNPGRVIETGIVTGPFGRRLRPAVTFPRSTPIAESQDLGNHKTDGVRNA